VDSGERMAKALDALRGCQVTVKKSRPGKKKKRKPAKRRAPALRREMTRAVYNSCAKKHRYRTRADATQHMHVLQSLRPATPLRVYGPCKYCGGWHLTSTPKLASGDRAKLGNRIDRAAGKGRQPLPSAAEEPGK